MRARRPLILCVSGLLTLSIFVATRSAAQDAPAPAEAAAAPATDATAAPPAAPSGEAPPASEGAAPPDAAGSDVVAQHGGVTLSYAFEVEGHDAKGTLARNQSGDIRLDLSMREPQTKTPIKTSVIVLSGDPDTAFNIVHTTRQMGRVTLPEALPDEGERYLVEELAGEAIQGFDTRHVKLTDTQSGDEFELWLAPSAGNLGLVDRALRSVQKYQGSLRAALKPRGIDGLPVKLIYKKRSSGAVTQGTLTEVAFGPVEDDRFAPPRGYSNTTMESLNPLEGSGGPVGNIKKLFKGFGRKR